MDLKIGEVLKEFRLEKGLKASYVAERLKIDPSTLSKYESGERRVPIELLPSFSKIYSCSIDNFFSEIIGDSPIMELAHSQRT